ncbi:MAG: hypothetical protein ABW360_15750 [Phenylobacterium sp.]
MDGAQHDADRSDLALLLPFYANGTLPPEERAAVNAALARDPELRAELVLVREVQAMVRGAGGALGVAPAVTTQRLWALLARL